MDRLSGCLLSLCVSLSVGVIFNAKCAKATQRAQRESHPESFYIMAIMIQTNETHRRGAEGCNLIIL